MSELVETGQGEGGEVLYDEMYGEILARIRNPDQYAEQPHRYRAVWQAVAVTSYVAALVAQARAAGAAEERERSTYRNEDGQELFCPRCGASDPEGYTREVLDS